METNPIEPSDENVISNFIEELDDSGRAFHETIVKRARNSLYAVAAMLFIAEMIPMFSIGFNWIILIISLIEAGIFIGFGLWTKRKPYSALLVGLIAFIAIIVLTIVTNTFLEGLAGALKAIFSGIIIKVAILVTLIKALSNAKQLQAIQNKSVR